MRVGACQGSVAGVLMRRRQAGPAQGYVEAGGLTAELFAERTEDPRMELQGPPAWVEQLVGVR